MLLSADTTKSFNTVSLTNSLVGHMGFLNNIFKKKDGLNPNMPPSGDDVKRLGNSLQPPPWEEPAVQEPYQKPSQDNVAQQIKQESKSMDMNFNDVLVKYEKPPVEPTIPNAQPKVSAGTNNPVFYPDTSAVQPKEPKIPPFVSQTTQNNDAPATPDPLDAVAEQLSPPPMPDKGVSGMSSGNPGNSAMGHTAGTPVFPSDVDHEKFNVQPRGSLFGEPQADQGPVEPKPVPLHNKTEEIHKFVLQNDSHATTAKEIVSDDTVQKSKEMIERAMERHKKSHKADILGKNMNLTEDSAESSGNSDDHSPDVHVPDAAKHDVSGADGQDNNAKDKVSVPERSKFTITKPIFLSLADIRRLTRMVGELNDGIKATQDAIVRADEINNDTELLYEKWREELEAAEERIVGFDKSMFSS